MIEYSSTENENALLVATFLIGDSFFCIDANRVQEVIQVKKLTPVHQAKKYIKGLINLRGRVVTLIDLREKLSLGTNAQNKANRIIIISWMQEHVGLLVDAMADVVQIDLQNLLNTPQNIHGIQTQFIRGVFQNNAGHIVGFLDIDKVLQIEESN